MAVARYTDAVWVRVQRYRRSAVIVPVTGLIATIAFHLSPGMEK